jgi:hypothetical protein
MKKNKLNRILSFVIAVLLFVSCDRGLKDEHFRISGTLVQENKTTFVLSKLDTNGYKVIDSFSTNPKGKFIYDVPVSQPSIYKLAINENDFIMFIAKNQNRIKITANAGEFSSSYKIEGSKSSEQLKILNNENVETRKKFAQMSFMLRQSQDEESFKAAQSHVQEQYLALQQQERKFTLDFINKNLGDLASLVALYRTFDGKWIVLADELDIYNKVLQGLKKTMPHNNQTIYLENCINKNQNLINHISNQQNGNAAETK